MKATKDDLIETPMIMALCLDRSMECYADETWQVQIHVQTRLNIR
jgi:hypothetical protein